MDPEVGIVDELTPPELATQPVAEVIEKEPQFDENGWLIQDDDGDVTDPPAEEAQDKTEDAEAPEVVAAEATPEVPVEAPRSVGLTAYAEAVSPLLQPVAEMPEPFRAFDPEIEEFTDYQAELTQYERDANRTIARIEHSNFQNAQSVVNHTLDRLATVAPGLRAQVQKMLHEMGAGAYSNPVTALANLTQAIGAAVIGMDETKTQKRVTTSPQATRQVVPQRGDKKDTSVEDREFAILKENNPSLTREDYKRLGG